MNPFAFLNNDEYMTPPSAWEAIQKYIPKNKVIWEAFYGDGKSGDVLRTLGFKVIHDEVDFFENNLGDVIVSNPPFSKLPQILERLAHLNKPFIIIMPSSKLNTQYFKKLFAAKIQIIVPEKRINFFRNAPVGWKSSCNFDCFYYCFKMKLPKDIIFLSS